MSEIYGLVSDSQSIGTITPSSTIPADGNIWGFAGEGTYPNAGNITVSAGKIAIFSRVGTTWNKVEVALPDAKIATWTATTFISGAQVIYNNRVYEANAATVATDVPGISPKFTPKLNAMIKEKGEFNEFNEALAVTSTVYGAQYKYSGKVPIDANTAYVLSTKGGNHSYILDIKFFNGSLVELTAPTMTVSNNAPVRSGKIFTTPATTAFIEFHWRFVDGSGNPLATEMMLHKGNTVVGIPYATYVGVYEFTSSSYLDMGKLKRKTTAYVAFDGSDSNDGYTETTPFATVQKALSMGVSTIYMKRGVYELQYLQIADLDSLTILPYNNSQTYAHATPKRDLIVFKNSKTLTSLTLNSGLLTQTFAGMSLWNEVFVTKTQTPMNGASPRVVLWKTYANMENDKRMTPVTTLAACQSTVDSFYWDGTTVYINTANDAKSFEATQNSNILSFNRIKKLSLTDVHSDYYNYQGMDIDACNGVMINCHASHVNYYNGFSIDNCVIDMYNCRAYKVHIDGFNFHNYGVMNMYDCESIYNLDDGCSHHDGCSGVIIGGNFSNNGKCGIAPAYGAQVNIHNVKAANNPTGVGYLTTNNGHAAMKGIISNCLLVNNTTGLSVNALATVDEWGNVYSGNTTNKTVAGVLNSY